MLIIIHKYTIIPGCVGKKTALLQAEASAYELGLANVQLCALAVHFILYFLPGSDKLFYCRVFLC